MSEQEYKLIYTGGKGEITEKKSRFIAQIKNVETEEEAQDFVAKVRKEYWDAKHHCYAFVIGEHDELQRFSDDGEPGGSAGRPMLDVLLHEHLHNAVAVVTRYFGGTLLGVGGLVRAYQGAVKEGLSHCLIVERIEGRELTIEADYTEIGRIQYLLSEKKITQLSSEYGQNVKLSVIVPIEQQQEIGAALTDATNAKAKLSWGECHAYAIVDGEAIFF